MARNISRYYKFSFTYIRHYKKKEMKIIMYMSNFAVCRKQKWLTIYIHGTKQTRNEISA